MDKMATSLQRATGTGKLVKKNELLQGRDMKLKSSRETPIYPIAKIAKTRAPRKNRACTLSIEKENERNIIADRGSFFPPSSNNTVCFEKGILINDYA